MKQKTVLSAMFKGLIIALAICALIFITLSTNSLREEHEENVELKLELHKATLVVDNFTESSKEAVDSEEQVRSLQQELLEKNDIISKQTATIEIMSDQLGGNE